MVDVDGKGIFGVILTVFTVAMFIGIAVLVNGLIADKNKGLVSSTATVNNESFDPGSDASGNAWVNLLNSDIVNGSEVVQSNLAGNSSYVLSHPNDYVLDAVRGRINVTNGSAYANTDLNISYQRSVQSNSSIANFRAHNLVSSLSLIFVVVVGLGGCVVVALMIFAQLKQS